MSNGLVYFRDAFGEHFIDPLLIATAERLGVDLASTGNPAELEGLQEGCARCHSKERCGDWLLSSGDGERRHFCMNTDGFAKLSGRAVKLRRAG